MANYSVGDHFFASGAKNMRFLLRSNTQKSCPRIANKPTLRAHPNNAAILIFQGSI